MPTRRTVLKTGLSSLAMPFLLTSGTFAQSSRVRRSAAVMAADDPFFADYSQAIAAMHDPALNGDMRSWRNQAMIHFEDCHKQPADFIAWHRVYLSKFEEICGALIGKNDFALAYWDWTLNDGLMPTPFFDIKELNVEHWNDDGSSAGTVAKRALDRSTGLMTHPRLGGAFLRRNIETILRESDYRRFLSTLEGGPHNNAHAILGGNMLGHMGAFLSPLDPIFWLHHCNVDRLWAEWQTAGNLVPLLDNIFPNHFADKSGVRQTYAAKDFVELTALPYTYDSLIGRDPLSPLILSSKQFDELAVAAGVSSDHPIGSTANETVSVADVETRVTIETSGLLREIFSSRAFRPVTALDTPRGAVEPRRILARLSDVKRGAKAEKLVGNVFVNCAYLNPETGVTDRHFAGSFAFFGPGGHHVNAEEFVVDISEPLRVQAEQGRITEDSINVQIMPVSVDDAPGEASFTVGNVEILST
jgi:tyrosinase